MRKLLTGLFILIGITSFGQQIQYIGGPETRVIGRNELEATNLFVIPSRTDTNFTPYKAGGIIFRTSDKRMYLYDGSKWRMMQDNFTSTWVDTVVAINDSTIRIIKSGSVADIVVKGKQDIAPTFFTNALNDTTLRFTYNGVVTDVSIKGRSGNSIEDISRSNDSVFITKNGVKTFAFKDSLGLSQAATAANVGSGIGFYKQQFKGEIQLRTIFSQNPNLIVTQNTNDIVFNVKSFIDSVKKSNDSVFFYKDGSKTFAFKDSVGAGGSGASEVANLGTGAGVFKEKSGDTLKLKSLIPDFGVQIDNNANDITISIDTTSNYGLATKTLVNSKTFYANSITDLKTKNPSEGALLITLGYATPGDGGGSIYRWNSSLTTTSNDIDVISANGVTNGRWELQVKGGKVTAAELGLSLNETSAAKIKAAFNLAVSKGWEIDITGHTIDIPTGDSLVFNYPLLLTSSNIATSIIKDGKYIIPRAGIRARNITFENFSSSAIGISSSPTHPHFPTSQYWDIDIEDCLFKNNYRTAHEITPGSSTDTTTSAAILRGRFVHNRVEGLKYAGLQLDMPYQGFEFSFNTFEGCDSATFNIVANIGLDGANNVYKQKGLRAIGNYYKDIVHNQDPTGTFYGVLLSGIGLIYNDNTHDNFSAPVYLRGDEITANGDKFINGTQYTKYAMIIKDGNPNGSLSIFKPIINGFYGSGIYVDSRFKTISIISPEITLNPKDAYVGDAGIRIIAGSAVMDLLSIKGGSINNNQTNSGTYAVMLSNSGYIRDVDIDGVSINSLAGGISSKLINTAGKVTVRNSPSFKFVTTSALGASVVDFQNNQVKYSTGTINLYAKKTGFIRDNLVNPDSALSTTLSRLFNMEADGSINSATYYTKNNESDFTKLVNFIRLEDTVKAVYVNGDRVINGVNGSSSAYVASATNGPDTLRVEMDNFKNPFNAQVISSSTANQHIRVFVKNGKLGRQSLYSFTGTAQSYDTSWIENVNMPWEPITDNTWTVNEKIKYGTTNETVNFSGKDFRKNADSAIELKDQPYIYVAKYGLVRDSVTDNTTAFRSAIAAAEAQGGGIVFIPEGKYVTDSLNLPRGVSLVGSGVGTTSIKLKNNSTATAFLSLYKTSESVVRDFTIDGNKVNQTTAIDGIKIWTDGTNNYNYNLLISNLYIRNNRGNGINALHPSWVFEVKNCRIRDNNGWGVYNSSTDNSFTDLTISLNAMGGFFNYGANTRVVGGKFIFNGFANPGSAGIYDSSSRSQYRNIEVQENYYHGIYLKHTNSSVIDIVSDMNNVIRRPQSTQYAGVTADLTSVAYGLKMVNAKNNTVRVHITSANVSAEGFTQYGKFVDQTSTGNTMMIYQQKQFGADSISMAGKNLWLQYRGANKIVSTDADFSVSEDTSTYILTAATNTADRVITLPDPSKTTASKFVFVARGSTANTYNWKFNQTVGSATSTETDSIPNNSVVTLERFDNGSGQWRITNIWEPLKVGGSSNTFDAQDFTKSGDTVSIKGYSLLGTIYNKSSWAALTDFTNNGSTPVISGDKISIQGGAGTFTQSLDLNGHTLLEKWKMVAKVKVMTKSTTSYGFGLGIRSDNSFGYSNVTGRFNMSSATGTGKVLLNGGTENTQLAESSVSLTFSVNDTIELTVERNVSVLTVTARNVTTGSAEVSATYTYTLPSAPYMHNTGRFSIFSMGGQFDVQSLKVTSNEIVNANIMTIGDSKTQGYNTTAFGNRYSTLLNQTYAPVVISAGGYDRTGEVIKRLPEIKSLAPKQVLLAIGSNDPRSGQGASYEANYSKIVDSLESWGIRVIHLMPFYETTTDLSAQRTFIRSIYTDTIDTWTPLTVSGMLDADGVHPNNAGNVAIAKAITEAFKLQGVNVTAGASSVAFADITSKPTTVSGYGITDAVSGSGTANKLAKFSSSTGISSSNITDDGTTVTVTTPAIEINSTGLPNYLWNKTNGTTNQKLWDAYVDDGNMYFRGINDARNAATNWLRVNRTGTTFNYASFSTPLLVNTTTTVSGYNLITQGKVLFQNTTGNVTLEVRPQVDYRWEIYHFNNSIKFSSINDARTTGQDIDLIGKDITISNYASSTLAERFRFTAAGLLNYASDKKASYTDRTVPDWGAVKAVVHDSITANILASSTRSLVKVSDADYTIASGTGDITIVYFAAMTAARTVTLPSATSNTGRRITIKHGGDGNFNINLSPAVKSNSSTATSSIGQGNSIMFESDGTDWIKVY